MESKNLIITIESILLVALIGFLIYGYNQYSILNKNHNELTNSYNNLKTEFDSFTNFGTSKIKLPIDSNDEAVLVALNSAQYKNFYSKRTYQTETPELLTLVINVPASVLNIFKEKKEAYSWIPANVNSLYIVKIVEKPLGSNSVSDTVFNIYIDSETGNVIKAESETYYAGIS